MFRALLYDQWKAVSLPLALTCVVGFAIPVLSVQQATANAFLGLRAGDLLTSQALWGTAYPLLAAGVGLLLAVTAWARDHSTHHVYALSLPLARWKYAMLKFGVGAMLLVPIVLTLGAGALLSSLTASVPDGLSAYPVALTIRFGLTSLLAFSVFFAISSGTPRTAAVVLGTLALIIGATVFTYALGLTDFWARSLLDIIEMPGGPFDSFGGRWMLIDV